MTRTAQLYRIARGANILLFAAGLALLVDQSVAAALARVELVAHWRSDDRALVVVDKTGQAIWNQATRHAVEVWNAAAPGTGLRLTWTTGTGECTMGGSRIEICQQPYQTLGDDVQNEREGLADLRRNSDHGQAHIAGVSIAVCSNCQLEQPRRRVIATHELGHALGLEHTLRRASVMYPSGGPDRPDEQDVATLAALYAHVDAPDRCGVLHVRVGPICL